MVGRRTMAAAALAMASALAAAGCAHHAAPGAKASASARARAAVSALAANPQAQQDKTKLENELLACIKTQHTPTAITHCAFPKGDTKAITHYAVQTFTLPVLHTKGPGSARDQWVQGVATFALAHGGAK